MNSNTLAGNFLKELITRIGISIFKGFLLGVVLTIILVMIEKSPSLVDKFNLILDQQVSLSEDKKELAVQESENETVLWNIGDVSDDEISDDGVIDDVENGVGEIIDSLSIIVCLIGIIIIFSGLFEIAFSLVSDEYDFFEMRHCAMIKIIGGATIASASLFIRFLHSYI